MFVFPLFVLTCPYLSFGRGGRGRCTGHPTGLPAGLYRPHTAALAGVAGASLLALSVALLGRAERHPRRRSNEKFPRIGGIWVTRLRSGQSVSRRCDQHSHKGRNSFQWAVRTLRTFPCTLCVDRCALGSRTPGRKSRCAAGSTCSRISRESSRSRRW